MSAEADGFEFRQVELTPQERDHAAFLHGIGFHGQAVGIETGVLGVVTIDCDEPSDAMMAKIHASTNQNIEADS